MALAIYMDVHVPTAVTTGLRRRGIDALTSQEDDTRESEDETLLQRATELDRILYTQDSDLLAIASQWQQQSREFSGVVYCHQLKLGIGDVIEELELLLTCADKDELSNHVTYLPLQ